MGNGTACLPTCLARLPTRLPARLPACLPYLSHCPFALRARMPASLPLPRDLAEPLCLVVARNEQGMSKKRVGSPHAPTMSSGRARSCRAGEHLRRALGKFGYDTFIIP